MRENHSVAVEPKPQGVQVVERVGLVAFSFQFFTRLAAVFAEEFGATFHTARHRRSHKLVWAIRWSTFRIHLGFPPANISGEARRGRGIRTPALRRTWAQ